MESTSARMIWTLAPVTRTWYMGHEGEDVMPLTHSMTTRLTGVHKNWDLCSDEARLDAAWTHAAWEVCTVHASVVWFFLASDTGIFRPLCQTQVQGCGGVAGSCTRR